MKKIFDKLVAGEEVQVNELRESLDRMALNDVVAPSVRDNLAEVMAKSLREMDSLQETLPTQLRELLTTMDTALSGKASDKLKEQGEQLIQQISKVTTPKQ